jgi:hypothetical protein
MNKTLVKMLSSSSVEESKKINNFKITSLKNFSLTEIIKNAYRVGKRKVIETIYKSF